MKEKLYSKPLDESHRMSSKLNIPCYFSNSFLLFLQKFFLNFILFLFIFKRSESQQQQKEKNNNFSPSPQQQLSPKFSDKKQSSPTSAAIGRHTAVPVLPPSTLLSNGPKPRLCLLIKGSPSQEFGFSLHAEGNGHFIGAVDSDGIAERAGLVTGQRIVGVNGHLVYPNTSHMDIVQIIQREPLRTELLVATEQVDRFYKEYGLAFSYEYVQFYDPIVMRNGNGKPPQLGGAAATRPKQSPNAVKNQNYEKGKTVQRSRSGSRSVERNPSNKNNGHAIRGRGQSLGKRPPTPSTTYLSSSEQINGHVAVQIEKRSDNMTSIEIGEIDDTEPTKTIDENSQHLFGVGTPPSSRCEEKLKNGHHSVKNGGGKITNGVAGKTGRGVEHVENSVKIFKKFWDTNYKL
ncbi:unnamed protein product [Meloidogyne enterolobii]|uniref:Uncharacterized protein n=1 Tax=Meloidogyne enterolobii TaxID=390850 RepID=A0ACB0ZZI9_MELEN